MLSCDFVVVYSNVPKIKCLKYGMMDQSRTSLAVSFLLFVGFFKFNLATKKLKKRSLSDTEWRIGLGLCVARSVVVVIKRYNKDEEKGKVITEGRERFVCPIKR